MGRQPLVHNVALEDRLLAALRESDGGMTAAEAATAIGTVPCLCQDPRMQNGLADRHRDMQNFPSGCGGSGWRIAFDTDVRARLQRLEHQGTVGRSNVGGRVLFWGRVKSADVFSSEAFWLELGEDVDRMFRRRDLSEWEQRFWDLWNSDTWPNGIPYTEQQALRLLGIQTWP